MSLINVYLVKKKIRKKLEIFEELNLSIVYLILVQGVNLIKLFLVVVTVSLGACTIKLYGFVIFEKRPNYTAS